MELSWERNFREQMRKRREALDESQSAFARRLTNKGLSFHQPTVQRIEDGERPVRLDEAFVIAEALGTSVPTMVASSSDVRVDATMAVNRFQRFAEDAAGALHTFVGDWEDAIIPLVDALGNAMQASPDHPSEIACWLGAWTFKAVELQTLLFRTADRFAAFDVDTEDLGDLESSLPYDVYYRVARESVEDEAYWSRVDELKRPAALAALHPRDLYYDFLNHEGRFAPEYDIEPILSAVSKVGGVGESLLFIRVLHDRTEEPDETFDREVRTLFETEA